MSNVLRFKRTVKPAVAAAPARKTDPWCAKLVMDDGRQISGGAAREARLKAVDGVDELLRDTLAKATLLAAARKIA